MFVNKWVILFRGHGCCIIPPEKVVITTTALILNAHFIEWTGVLMLISEAIIGEIFANLATQWCLSIGKFVSRAFRDVLNAVGYRSHHIYVKLKEN